VDTAEYWIHSNRQADEGLNAANFKINRIILWLDLTAYAIDSIQLADIYLVNDGFIYLVNDDPSLINVNIFSRKVRIPHLRDDL
jgi:hypothetical protein